ncbi:Ca2+ regulator and membrane fusion protein Fig1-domain-containing protein [Echria macrotheca]|uniref:Ca2+ regulator and membrane fusion protein Fig1-domain-containing protein n=1 Tax=Echria macrotheca TaxID=438768 RepID=A0AAJ0B5X7_9PEZI|nr:Ca2+ regulator and membrane fusion protein Fig1-domain-containing protein [Echria macrotheca]
MMAPSKLKLMHQYTAERIGREHGLMILTAISTILVSILLAGCSSSQNLSAVYVLSMYYQIPGQTAVATQQGTSSTHTNIANMVATAVANSTPIEVRAGYFNLCVRRGNDQWECCRDPSALQIRLSDADPLGLIGIAGMFRGNVILPWFLILQVVLHLVTLSALAAFSSWHEDSPALSLFSGPSLARTAQFASGAAAFFALLSALWQHAAASAVQAIIGATSFGYVVSKTGAAAMAIGWISYFLLLFVFFVILMMRRYWQNLNLPACSSDLGMFRSKQMGDN